MVTRTEGYRRSAGKEERTLAVVRSWLQSVFELDPTFITDRERNRTQGDLQLGDATAECKGQPIDPTRYCLNFVEVMEDTSTVSKAIHRGGFARTAALLGVSEDELAATRYVDRRQRAASTGRIGHLTHASCSLESIAGSAVTVYANADPEHTFVYLYSRRFLLQHLRQQVLSGHLVRGAGNSNEDTFGAFVPNSPARWQRDVSGWKYVGPGAAPLRLARALLLGARE